MDMSEQTEGFVKMFSLYQFRVFRPDCKEHLSGTEWMALMYILERRLLYIRFDPKAVNGNTVRIDAAFKQRMYADLGIREKSFEALITKLVKGGIFYRLKNGWFMVNPYAFCKGTHTEIVRRIGVFRSSTIAMPLTRKKMPQFLATPSYKELVAKISDQNRAYAQKSAAEKRSSGTADFSELADEEMDFFFPAETPDGSSAGRPDKNGLSSLQGRSILRFFQKTDSDGT